LVRKIRAYERLLMQEGIDGLRQKTGCPDLQSLRVISTARRQPMPA